MIGTEGGGCRPRILPFGATTPSLAPDSVVLPGATVIGRVSIGSRSSVWYGCVIRADEENIRIGADSNIQDCAVLHADPGFPVAIGDRVTVGHGAIVHGSFVDHDSLVGMGAVLLNGCHIGSNSIVAAGSVVREGAAIPAGCLVAGTPGVVKRDLAAAEIAQIQNSWNGYVQRARRHRESLYGTIRAPE